MRHVRHARHRDEALRAAVNLFLFADRARERSARGRVDDGEGGAGNAGRLDRLVHTQHHSPKSCGQHSKCQVSFAIGYVRGDSCQTLIKCRAAGPCDPHRDRKEVIESKH